MAFELKTLEKLLIAPHEVIPKVEKENVETAIVQMIINLLLIGVAIGVAIGNFVVPLVILVTGAVANLFLAFLLYLSLLVAGGRGKYSNSLTALTFPFFGVSLGILLTSLLSKVNSILGIIGGSIVLSLYFVVGLVGYMRILADTFKLDIVTVWIVSGLFFAALLLSLYVISVVLYMYNFPNLLSLTSSPLTPF